VHGPIATLAAPLDPPGAPLAPAEPMLSFVGIPGFDGVDPSTHATTLTKTPSPRNAQGPSRMSLIESSLATPRSRAHNCHNVSVSVASARQIQSKIRAKFRKIREIAGSTV